MGFYLNKKKIYFCKDEVLVVFLALFVAAQANSVFLGKEEASQVLSRNKRANFGIEEFKEGDLNRECYDEQCNYEEAREVFEDDAQTDAFWEQLTNQCAAGPCDETGMESCVNIYNGHVCICKSGYTGRECEFEINYCSYGYCPEGSTCVDEVNSFSCLCPVKGCKPKPAEVVQQEEQP